MSEKPPTEEFESKEQEISPEDEKKMISKIKVNLKKMGSEEVDQNKPPK